LKYDGQKKNHSLLHEYSSKLVWWETFFIQETEAAGTIIYVDDMGEQKNISGRVRYGCGRGDETKKTRDAK